MTLSNFDWTDKNSVRWFILLPSGHEGPYSFNQLLSLSSQKKIKIEESLWAEGLDAPLQLKEVIALVERLEKEKQELEEVEEEIPPPLPPFEEVEASAEDEVPPVPYIEEEVPVEAEVIVPKKRSSVPLYAFGVASLSLMLFFSFSSLVKNKEKVEVRRLSKMPVELQERIQRENIFGGWNKKIFFKEYLPQDHSHLWLVTSSFQNCRVEASFHSIKDKILSMKDEKVSFKTQGDLRGHIVEFSSFDFTEGNKLLPGMYEMDVKAFDCQWDSLFAKVMNKFSPPEKEYMARTKVILYSKGPEEFTQNLDKVLLKKMEVALKEQSQNELFWQDLQQKLQTLEAITLQIEQHLLDHLDTDPAHFKKNLPQMVDQYTRKFGSFLTSFVVENENHFKSLSEEAKGASQKRNYELMVRLASKRIGLETMKFIEEFQAMKKTPVKKDLLALSEKVKKNFGVLKQDLGKKLVLVSEDRSK